MIKYYLYFILALLVVIFLLEIIRFFYRNTKKYKELHPQTANLVGKIPNNLKIVAIGSGPGKNGISFKYLKEKGYNFCTAPQNLKYGFGILKKFSKKYSENAVIILVICPLSFGNNKSTLQKNYSDEFYWILSPAEINGYSFKRALKLRYVFFKDLLKEVRKKEPIKKHNAVTVTDTWKKQFDLCDFSNPEQSSKHRQAFDEKVEILSATIKFCKRNKYNPVIVIPPVPLVTTKHFSNEFLQEFLYKNISRAKGFENIPVLDYLLDERFKEEHFKNDIFLNESGAKSFSMILFSDIEKSGIIK